jgi:hypothetical protein
MTTIIKSDMQLSGGRHVMRIVADSNGGGTFPGDIDYLQFVP